MTAITSRYATHSILAVLVAVAGGDGEGGLFRSHPETDKRLDRLVTRRDRPQLDAGAMLPDRYAANVSYEHVDPGRGVIESQARGIAGGASEEAAADAEERDEGDEERESQEDSVASSKRKLTLKRLANTRPRLTPSFGSSHARKGSRLPSPAIAARGGIARCLA